ncbi:MAG: methionine--tRNA ligase [Candidatus Nealsonbacteria bacterium RIFCSPHIGHO2_02_FULL_43_13]|uniref:Methionine--tRNA ligase n=1 Tax=Candidatus Nealsonbacteria bacterium RIFCSPHIGHO2_02_FULL_43_13 TaxID=1801668 RepID=A0A1G2E8U6_9BACT|nr:MAG: methionine--tRNA ligase [Candidatus Nealsonbacteria bacterium RIFCSPHIGHO2_02_FULL_43_13]
MKNKFYITTSIAYTNAPPHIGFALELVQADVLARYRRIAGDDVFFLTGTDEHGAKIVRAAKNAGKTPEEFTEEVSKKFKKLTEALNLSNDDFIRTTDQKKHWPSVIKVWLKLKENGDIYKKEYEGLYCVGCEAFIKEKDLVNGLCPLHQQKPEIIKEENYFFRLSKYADIVKEKIVSGEIKIVPDVRKNEIISFINQGLEDVSCSRSKENLKWGIPVPEDDSQIIYIWFEALINYLYPKKYWPADVHCVGKDIFRFHALWWPAMLLSLGLPLPKVIFVHGYIASGGQKMSKSLGNVVDPFELVKKYGADAVRYFLLREISPTEDGDYTEDKFIERYNGDLASGLGNLVARVMRPAETFNISKTKNEKELEIKTTHDTPLFNTLESAKMHYKKAIEEFKFNEALFVTWELISFCDFYINQERPWEGKNNKVISDLLFLIEEIANMLKPFLPETSEKILKQLKNKKSEPLFPRFK